MRVGWGRGEWGIANRVNRNRHFACVGLACDRPPPNSFQMTKTELQSALAYKEIKKNGEFVLPGFGKLVKQKRKARTGFNPKTRGFPP